MEQLELFEIPSPCVGVCEANCKGYLRSRFERLHWLKMTNAEKRQVIRLLKRRRQRLELLAAIPKQQKEVILEQKNLEF